MRSLAAITSSGPSMRELGLAPAGSPAAAPLSMDGQMPAMESGQTHVKRYLEPLAELIREGKLDITSMITHRSTDLADGPDLYKTFRDKADGCVKVVFHPK